MQNTKSNGMVIIAIVIMLIFSACGVDDAKIEFSDQSEFLWQIAVLKVEIADNLTNTQSFIQYDGIVEEVPYEQKPSEGMKFLLLELQIDKGETGGEPFSWEDVYIQDKEERRYFRMENDSFLEDYNLPRLKGTTLTIGGSKGFVCYEIPLELEIPDITFVHQSVEGENKVKL